MSKNRWNSADIHYPFTCLNILLLNLLSVYIFFIFHVSFLYRLFPFYHKVIFDRSYVNEAEKSGFSGECAPIRCQRVIINSDPIPSFFAPLLPYIVSSCSITFWGQLPLIVRENKLKSLCYYMTIIGYFMA